MMKAIQKTILLQWSKLWEETILGAKEYDLSYQLLLERLKIRSLECLQHFLDYYGITRQVLPLNSMKNPQWAFCCGNSTFSRLPLVYSQRRVEVVSLLQRQSLLSTIRKLKGKIFFKLNCFWCPH